MLVMRSTFPVSCARCPTVPFEYKIFLALTYHRFYTDCHTLTEHWTGTPPAIIRHLWIFVHFMSHTMPHHLTDNGETSLLTICLNSITDISDTLPFDSLSYSDKERLLSRLHESHYFRVNLTYCKSIGRIADKAILTSSAVNGNHVTVFKDYFIRWYTMNNLVIYRRAY